ncbi:MAG: hypothetical protein ACYDFU_03510 [Nitrospirota bacterium]
MYLMKAGENSVIGITLYDKIINTAKVPGRARRGRKAKAEMAEVEPKRRAARKPISEKSAAGVRRREYKSKTEKVEISSPEKVKKPGRSKKAVTKKTPVENPAGV